MTKTKPPEATSYSITQTNDSIDSLLNLLQNKGIITKQEVDAIKGKLPQDSVVTVKSGGLT